VLTATFDAVAVSLCAMCQEILEVPSVSSTDDIFDLDPDSLTLQRLNVRIQETWGVTVPVDVFYDTESIGDLARVIHRLTSGT
jgi:acyl carrier protein